LDCKCLVLVYTFIKTWPFTRVYVYKFVQRDMIFDFETFKIVLELGNIGCVLLASIVIMAVPRMVGDIILVFVFSLRAAFDCVNKQNPTDTQDRTIKQTNMGNEP
jgi:hypothetical protein